MIIIACLYAALSVAAVAARQLGSRAAPALKGLPVAFLLFALTDARLFALGEASLAYYLVIAGLAFGLAGDLLFLDKGRFFKRGIVAFLVGHLWYIAAFAASGMTPVSAPLWPLGAYFSLYAVVLFKSILAKHRAYWGFAAAYLAGIAAMTVCAALSARRSRTPPTRRRESRRRSSPAPSSSPCRTASCRCVSSSVASGSRTSSCFPPITPPRAS